MKTYIPLAFSLFILWTGMNPIQAQTNLNQANKDVAWGAEVNTYSGNFFYQIRILGLPGSDLPLDLGLSYNSDNYQKQMGLGLGWTYRFGLQYSEAANGDIAIDRPDGRQDSFPKSGGIYNSPAGNFDSLVKTVDTVKLTNRSGATFHFNHPSHKKLTRIRNLNGNQQDFVYDASFNLITVTDPLGRSLTLGWSGGKLRTIIENNSSKKRIWFFGYEEDRLDRISDPMGNKTSFSYDATNRLQSIQNPLGHALNISYYPNGAVQQTQVPAVGIAQTYSYDAGTGTTIVEETVGAGSQSTSYEYDALGRLTRRLGNCCGYDVQYEYDAQHNVNKETDANAGETTYTYDLNGNVLTETDALGKTASYTYDPSLKVPLSLTNKRGHLTTFSYDAAGNLIQTDYPHGVTEHQAFDASGRRTLFVDGEGDSTTYTYDAYGNLSSETRSDGSGTSFSYNALGTLSSSSDANGTVTTYSYDVLNRLSSRTDPKGSHSFSYDGTGNLLTETDPLGHSTTYTYDAIHRRTSVTRPMGHSTSFSYDQKNPLSKTEANGNVHSYVYDSFNRLTSQTEFSGTRSYSYDATGNLLSETSPAGNTTSYTYDAMHRRITQTDPLSRTSSFEYDAHGNLTKGTDPKSQETHYTYDSLDRRMSQVNALGDTTRYQYDANRNVTQVKDPDGHTHRFDFDALDRLVSVVDPMLDTVFTYTYDNNDNRLTETDGEGNTTTYTYDIHNRPLSISLPEGELISLTYDAAGRKITETQATGLVSTYTYDDLNRVTRIQDNLGDVVSYEYDIQGNLRNEVNGTGDTTYYTYDASSRLLEIKDPKGNSEYRSYNADGYMVREIDRKGDSTRYVYDGNNRPRFRINTLEDTVKRSYDELGNLTSAEDSKGQLTTFTYDALNRRIREDFADGSNRQFGHDQASNVIWYRRPSGDTVHLGYDARDRLSLRTYPGGEIDHFHYDKADRLDSAWNSIATVSFLWSASNRLLRERLNGQTSTYAYDILNRRISHSYPSGRTIIRDYDHRNRLSTLMEGATTLASMTYNLSDFLTARTYINGTSLSIARDDNNWASQVTHSSGGAFWDVAYTYDTEGNRTLAEKLHRSSHSEAISYNVFSNLTDLDRGTVSAGSIPSPTFSQGLNFDKAGNRSSLDDDGSLTTYTSNNINQYTALTSGATLNPGYDLNANLSFDGSQYYFYDAQNRLIKISSDLAGTISLSQHAYGPLGRRIYTVVGPDTTRYYYDDVQVIEEQSSGPTRTYIYGHDLDEILEVKEGINSHYFHHDALGSVVSITNAAGSVLEHYEYDAFGHDSLFSPAFAPLVSSSIGNTYRYAARRKDTASGLLFMRERWYAPDLGRFLQPDPEGYKGDPRTLHRYSYAMDNPYNLKDPLGRHSISSGQIAGSKREARTPAATAAGNRPFGWNYRFKYNLTGAAGDCNTTCNITGYSSIRVNRAPGVTAAQLRTSITRWQTGINRVWNNAAHLAPVRNASFCPCQGKNKTCCECDRINIVFRVTFYPPYAHSLIKNPDQIITVNPGTHGVAGARTNMTSWHVGDAGWIGAHEFGHMIGLVDEYIDPTVERRKNQHTAGVNTSDNSIMSNGGAAAIARIRHFGPVAQQVAKTLKRCTYHPKLNRP